jgi:hypothetical protein
MLGNIHNPAQSEPTFLPGGPYHDPPPAGRYYGFFSGQGVLHDVEHGIYGFTGGGVLVTERLENGDEVITISFRGAAGLTGSGHYLMMLLEGNEN